MHKYLGFFPLSKIAMINNSILLFAQYQNSIYRKYSRELFFSRYDFRFLSNSPVHEHGSLSVIETELK